MVSDDVRKDGSSDEPVPTSDGSQRAGSPEQRGDVTQILSAIEQGDGQAAEQLLPLVYQELRKLAADRMAQEKPGQTLQPTALVHEAYLRLVDVNQAQHWDSRGHFFSAAAEAMRRILVDRARHKETLRAGGDIERVELEQVESTVVKSRVDLIALNEALERLEQEDPRKAKLIKLRYFAGLTIPDSAEILGIATSTAIADWAYARSWLRLELADMS
jgi:RNA polymerase sigma factor (TIGR02999 family)